MYCPPFVLALPLRALLCLLLLSTGSVNAQEQDTAQEPTYTEQATALHEQVQQSVEHLRQLDARRLASTEDSIKMIFQRRFEATAVEALEQAQALVQLVAAQEEAGEDPGKFGKIAREMLESLPQELRTRARRLLDEADFGKDLSTLSAVEQIALEARLEQITDRLLRLYRILLVNLELSEQLEIDTEEQERFLNEAPAEAAAHQSAALELAQERGATLARQVKALPEDTELAALARVNDARIHWLNTSLHQLVEMMEQLDMRVVEYRQQLLTATGTVTTDILDFEVFEGLLVSWLDSAGAWTKDNLPGIVFNIVLFLLILWGALLLAGLTRRLVDRGLNRASNRLSQLLRRMIVSSAGNIVLILGLLFGLAQLGISVGPLLAGLGIAGFIIGFALQDTLGNFASGMLILLYRPYDVGDFIETNGVLGKVSHMSLVNTTVLTIDNQTLVLPNSKIWGDVIKNVTAQRERRVDMVFGIGYADDIAKAEEVLNDIVSCHDKVLDEPQPVVRLHTLNESSVDFVVRPWVKTEDYWDVYWDITRAVKMRFDEEDISIPFPQRDVHLFTEEKIALATVAPGSVEQASVAATGSQPRDQEDGGNADAQNDEIA